MSKLNKKSQPLSNTQVVVKVAAKNNLQLGISANGNLQFKKEPLQHLYEIVVSTFFGKDTYYQTSNQLVTNMKKEVAQAVKMEEFDFVANLAIHARTEMHMRTIPIVLVVQFANELRNQGKSYPQLRQLVCDVIQRADQITDLFAYALDVFGGKNKVPMAIRRGVADACNKFGEYGFAKYDRAGMVKFKDVLRMVHPTAKNETQGMIFKKIMEDCLETPYTWETELSMNGQRGAERLSDKTLWTQLIESGKVGYMAMLRNLRNIIQAGVESKTSSIVAGIISDQKEVAKSKQLPFDLLEAYKIVKPLDTKLATAVSKAIDLSCSNIPQLGNNVWIIIDYSGSMGSDDGIPINSATMMASALIKSSDMVDNLAVTLFGDEAKTLHGVDANNSVIGLQKDLLRHRTGRIAGYTNFDKALDERQKLGFAPDTIIVFTDGEVNRFPYRKLQALSGNVIKITVNMAAAPTTPLLKEDGWLSLSGWSTAIFKWIPAIREKETVVDKLSVPYMGLNR